MRHKVTMQNKLEASFVIESHDGVVILDTFWYELSEQLFLIDADRVP